jgi:hypothetical protein
MPAIINSAPDCITHNEGGQNFAEDGADFILQANYQDCAGIMTFGPGSTYGEDGTGAETLYMILTWVGIVTMVVVLVAWVIYENRRLVGHVARFGVGRGPATGLPPQPGGIGDERGGTHQ